jgi:mycothiol maleylpyruvate isomerase-like protein
MTMRDLVRSIGQVEDVDLLASLWKCWHQAGTRLSETAWTHASGLGDWRVRELYAHVSRGITTLTDLVAQPIDGDAELSHAAAYFAALRPLGDAGAKHVAAVATEWALRPIDALVDDFDAPASAALDVVRANGNVVVQTIAGSMQVYDYLLTRVLEATVHLLDLGRAVADAPGVTEDALRRTVDVLTDLLPAEEFVALATGRAAPTAMFPILT